MVRTSVRLQSSSSSNLAAAAAIVAWCASYAPRAARAASSSDLYDVVQSTVDETWNETWIADDHAFEEGTRRVGNAVDLSSDGAWTAIGGEVSLTIWRRNDDDGEWTLHTDVTRDFQWTVQSVAFNRDGTHLVASERMHLPFARTIVYKYDANEGEEGGVWSRKGNLLLGSFFGFGPINKSLFGTDYFSTWGNAQALSDDGDTLAVANDGYDLVRVYDYQEDALLSSVVSWRHRVTVCAGEDGHQHFGSSIALAGDGNTLFVGAPRRDTDTGEMSGTTTVHDVSSSSSSSDDPSFTLAGDAAHDHFGVGVSVSADGARLVAVAAVGYARVYERDGDASSSSSYVPTVRRELLPVDAGGRLVSAALSADGSTAAAGRFDGRDGPAGRVHVFDADDDDAPSTALSSSRGRVSDAFGRAVAVDRTGSVVVVGAPQEGNRRGYVTVFERST